MACVAACYVGVCRFSEIVGRKSANFQKLDRSSEAMGRLSETVGKFSETVDRFSKTVGRFSESRQIFRNSGQIFGGREQVFRNSRQIFRNWADFQLTARLFTHSKENVCHVPREQQAKHTPGDDNLYAAAKIVAYDRV